MTPEEKAAPIEAEPLTWPATGEQLKAAGWTYDRERLWSVCRTPECGRRILWLWNAGEHPKRVPLEELPHDGDPDKPRLFQPHFISCPGAERWRNRPAARNSSASRF